MTDNEGQGTVVSFQETEALRMGYFNSFEDFPLDPAIDNVLVGTRTLVV